MSYVDGFVIPIKKKNIKAYKRMAQQGKHMWLKHGALDYKECLGDDLHVKNIGLAFPKMLKLKKNETVFFSYIVYKSKAHRDSVNTKVMKEWEKQPMPKNMPFDMKRMAYGGFKAIVEARGFESCRRTRAKEQSHEEGRGQF